MVTGTGERRLGTAQAAARADQRPLSALISAALLLLGAVAGVGGFAGAGTVSAVSSPSSVASASTTSTRVSTDRRSAPVLGKPGSQQQVSGWARHHPEPADVAVIGTYPPAGLVDAPIPTGTAGFALTIDVSHQGRAPPAGSLLS
jgi:hypothetical protein